MDIMGSPVVFWGLIAVVAYFVGEKLFKADEKVEARREDAFDLSQLAAANGLEFLVPLLRAYAVGNYSGVWDELKRLYRALGNAETLKSAMQHVFDVQLAKRLDNAEERAKIEAEIAKKIAA